MADLPAIAALNYDSGTISVTLDAVPSGQVEAGVFLGNAVGDPLASSAPSTAKTIDFPADAALFSSGKVYAVAITATPAGPHSPWLSPVELVFDAPAFTAARVVGDTVEVAWTLPQTTNIAGTLVSLYDTSAGGGTVVSGTFGGLGCRLDPAIPLDPAHTYEIYASGTLGVASGPMVRLTKPLILDAPTVRSVEYDAARQEITVAPAVDATSGTILATLLGNGRAVQSASVQGSSVVLKLIEPLDAATRWTIGLAYQEGPVSGPAGIAVELPLQEAQVTAADFDGHVLHVDWVRPGATGAVVSFRTTMDVEVGSKTVTGFHADVTPSQPIDPYGTYLVRVAPVRGSVRGGFGGPTFLVVEPPEITTVACNGRQVVVDAAFKASPPPASEIALLRGDDRVASATGGHGGGYLAMPSDVPQQAAATLTVAMRAVSGVATGPWSSPAPVVTAVPTLTSASVAGTALSGHLLVPATPLVSGAVAVVAQYVDGSPASTPSDADGTGHFGQTLASQTAGALSVRSWVYGKAGSVVVTGPVSAATAIVTTASRGLALAYDGATITASWDAAVDPGVGAYEATLSVDGAASKPKDVPTPAATFAYTAPPAPADPVVTVAVAFVAGFARGPASTATALLRSPSLLTAIVDATNVTLAWGAVAGASAYEIAFPETGAPPLVVAGAEVTAAVALGASTLQLTALAPGVRGPSSAPEALIVTAPVLSACDFNLAKGTLDVSWAAVAGADAYRVELRTGLATRATHDTKTTSIALAASDLPAGRPISVRVRAKAGTMLTGPWSDAVAAVAAAPEDVRVRYDGRVAHVSWTAVRGEAVSGYRVTVGASGVDPVDTHATSADIAVSAATGATAKVVVQSLTAAGAGLPSVGVPLFSPGLYVSTDASVNPHLVPAASAAFAAADVVIHLPDLFTSTPTLPANPTFSLSAGSGPLPYTVTIAHDSPAWTFKPEDPPIRAAVKQDYDALLGDLASVLTAQGWHVFQDAVARSMPQTFAETLLYGCGFSPSDGYVDLRPGTILRVASEGYQYVGPSAPYAALINGYVGTGVADYEIGAFADGAGRWLTGFDAFLAAITQRGTSVPAPRGDAAGNVGGGGGAVDFSFPAFRQPFFRIVYPPALLRPEDPGMPEPGSNIAIVGAGDYPTLEHATDAIRRDGSIAAGAVATYLRGRATLTACIRVWVDGAPAVVPIGTTVANLLDGLGRRPPATSALPVDGVTLVRSSGAAIVNPAAATAGYDAGAGRPVRLDWASGPLWGTSIDRFALPLLAGDRLELGHR